MRHATASWPRPGFRVTRPAGQDAGGRRNADAESAYQQGIHRDPKNNPCRINYGLMLARLNRTNEAIIHLQAVLPPAQVHYNLASVYEQQGALARAKEELEKAIAANPNMTEAQNKLATLPHD